MEGHDRHESRELYVRNRGLERAIGCCRGSGSNGEGKLYLEDIEEGSSVDIQLEDW